MFQALLEITVDYAQTAAFFLISIAIWVFALCMRAAVAIANLNLLALNHRRGGRKHSLKEIAMCPASEQKSSISFDTYPLSINA